MGKKIYGIEDVAYWNSREKKMEVDYEIIDEEMALDLPENYHIEDLGAEAECILSPLHRYRVVGEYALGWLDYHGIKDEATLEAWFDDSFDDEGKERYRAVIKRMLELKEQSGKE